MFRVFVSLTAALPISSGNEEDGNETVYNYRGSLATGHFLGQLFRTLGQVINLPTASQGQRQAEVDLQGQRQLLQEETPREARRGSRSRRQMSPKKKRKVRGKAKSKTREVATQTDQEEEKGLCRAVRKLVLNDQEGDDVTTEDDVTNIIPVKAMDDASTTGAVPKVKAFVTRPSRPTTKVTAKAKKPEQTVACYSARGIKTRWKRKPKTCWEDTAKTLLDMTVIFLRKLPKSAVQHDHQVQTISQLSDLTLKAEYLSHVISSSEQVELGGHAITSSEEVGDQQVILSRELISWTCSMALHLLSHGKNNNPPPHQSISSLPKN